MKTKLLILISLAVLAFAAINKRTIAQSQVIGCDGDYVTINNPDPVETISVGAGYRIDFVATDDGANELVVFSQDTDAITGIGTRDVTIKSKSATTIMICVVKTNTVYLPVVGK